MSDPLDEFAAAEARKKPRDTIGKLADMLERSGIDVADVARINRVNVWQAMSKGEDGEPVVTDLTGIQLVPAWSDGPAWPVITPGPVVRVSKPKTTTTKTAGGWRTAVILPDIQIGYYRDGSDNLHPTHDEDAISVARAIVRAAKPDVLVLVGDNLDMPEMAKYRLSPPFQRTTQATIDRATILGAELRSDAGPDCEIVWLAGNHEARVQHYIIDNAVAAFGLKRGGAPESWPVLSVPHLCRFDDSQISFLPGYPANEYWVNERLRVIHGDKVNSRGSTAGRYLDGARHSTIYGHIHRREWEERTRPDRDGPNTIMAASPGCLARIDGKVPSTKSGIDLDGMPVGATENWQQGVAVVTFQPGDAPFVYEQVSIWDGWAMWRGREFRAEAA